MDLILITFNQNTDKVINSLKEDLKTIRTGRASPTLVENMMVETYGGQAKLRLLELSNIATEGPSTLLLTPFDPSTITDIEKAILKSPLGISPIVQGNRMLIKIPPLSQEQREKMMKLINQKIEEKKEIIRNYRDNTRKNIKNSLEDKIITEDDKFRLEKEVDMATQKRMEEIKNIKEKKEKEIMEV